MSHLWEECRENRSDQQSNEEILRKARGVPIKSENLPQGSMESDRLRRSIHVPICDEHFLSIRSKEKLRPTCVIINGVSIVTTLFIGLLIITASLDMFMIGFQWFLFLELSLIISVTSYVWLRPTELDRVISIYRIESGTKETVLKLKHKWYLDELLRLNPLTVKRVAVKRASD
ncbi:MAG: hypothetical protein ACXADC_11170 [Candidatus Thorarchaeota archaeon]